MHTRPGSRAHLSMAHEPRARNPARMSAVFQELLPAGIATAELSGPGDPSMLSTAERKHIGAAVAKRASEFAAGRLCARRALAQYGIHDYPLVGGADRRPQWPSTLVGSITHTQGFSAAAVAERSRFRGIGIDVESIGRVTRDVWSEVLLPEEQRWLEQLDPREQAQIAALMFSAKESFYKCQYELTSQWLDFQDVALDVVGWNLGLGSFAVHPRKTTRIVEAYQGRLFGRFAFRRGLVLTGIAIAVSDSV
ncbi:MAG TPA: 4'-phosphopantetheinyl transferase superfamily protein [Nevskiaceae bacterium]|nr:4'-phosphopantetheinyl transferase superfamily protein [Nevskiaceae bacterium]